MKNIIILLIDLLLSITRFGLMLYGFYLIIFTDQELTGFLIIIAIQLLYIEQSINTFKRELLEKLKS